MKTKKLHHILLISLASLLALAILAAVTILCINAHVVSSTSYRLLSPQEAMLVEDVDSILVLGCKVKSNGEPSDMLEDRLQRGVELYHAGVAPKLLMSGDHGTVTYNEVFSMKQYAIDHNIPSSNIFMDHAGFSTYESIYRARDVFQAKKIIIVTQEYHLYRALYIAEALGLEAYGVDANYRNYSGQAARDFREILARNKDFLTSIFKPLPTYLGDAIPISGSGDDTNDYIAS